MPIRPRRTMRPRSVVLLAAGAVLLAGYAWTLTDSAGSTGGPTVAQAAGGNNRAMSMAPGMVMPDGSTMGASAAPQHLSAAGPSAAGRSAAGAPAAGPSAADPSGAARMICSTEVRTDIRKVLALKATPQPTSRWTNHVYTCTYRLPMGTFVISVTESKDAAAAQTVAADLRKSLSQVRATAGLTATAFATPQGLVALVKDNDTLQVDATRLPKQFGEQQQKRTDFAYEIASDILGCWTEG
jgi:hypothetical protein